jgi:hypothetical protein
LQPPDARIDSDGHHWRSLLLRRPLPLPCVMTAVGIHGTQIHNRPPRTWTQTMLAIIFFLVFISGCLMIHAAQFVFLLPLRFLPLASAKSLYYAGIRLSEGAFGTLLSKCQSLSRWLRSSLMRCLVLMCQWFAPSRLVISFEQDGPGAFSRDEVDEIAIRGRDGRVLGLKMPKKSVLIANHQVGACPHNS